MRGFDVLAESMRRRGMTPGNSYSHAQVGEISSYDPNKHAVKVLIQPDGVESPWMPLGAMAVGMGCGIMVAPNLGDIVLVDFVGGDFSSPVVVARFFSISRRPAVLQPGEVLIQHVGGSLLKFNEDGSVNLVAAGPLNSSAPEWNHTGPVNINGPVSTTGPLTNNGVNVGSTHDHSGVRAGSDNSGPPT